MNFWKRAHNFPPILCRLLAKGRTDHPIARAATGAGLPLHLVDSYSWRTSWETIDLHHTRLFLQGCGLDFANARQMRRIDDYLSRRPTFRYLRTSKEWESRWLPMLKLWRQHWHDAGPDTLPSIRFLATRLEPLLKQS